MNINAGHNLVQLPMYPILIREFVKQTFNGKLFEIYKEFLPNFSMKKFYFEFGAFLQPRIVLDLFETDKKLVVQSIKNEA